MNRHLTVISLIVLSSMTYAQTDAYEAFKQQMMATFNQYADDQQAEYDAYRRQLNEAYATFMEESWQQMTAQPAVEMPKDTPQPPVVYEEPIEDTIQVQHEVKDSCATDGIREFVQVLCKKEVVNIPEPSPQPQALAPVVAKEMPHQTVEVDFYGTTISIAFPLNETLAITRLQEKELARVWKELSSEAYDITLSQALAVRDSLDLCDWAYLQLLEQVCQKHYGPTNEAVMMQAYLMAQSGYSIRLAHNKVQLFCLIASEYNIISMVYFLIDGQKFYPLHCQEKELAICKAFFEDEQKISLQIRKEQKLQTDIRPARELRSKYGIVAQVQHDQNIVDFYNYYPSSYIGNDVTTRWAVYANTPLEAMIRQDLYPTLRRSIEGLSERDAVNKLLNFVQTAFEYKYDEEVWGRDRAFFATETLYYPYADCEDRSILFSRLVRDIMGLDVVLIYYPGHLATAVAFTTDVAGDYLMHQGQRFVVCDPTYIGAPVGRTMPNMNNQTAQIIVL